MRHARQQGRKLAGTGTCLQAPRRLRHGAAPRVPAPRRKGHPRGRGAPFVRVGGHQAFFSRGGGGDAYTNQTTSFLTTEAGRRGGRRLLLAGAAAMVRPRRECMRRPARELVCARTLRGPRGGARVRCVPTWWLWSSPWSRRVSSGYFNARAGADGGRPSRRASSDRAPMGARLRYREDGRGGQLLGPARVGQHLRRGAVDGMPPHALLYTHALGNGRARRASRRSFQHTRRGMCPCTPRAPPRAGNVTMPSLVVTLRHVPRSPVRAGGWSRVPCRAASAGCTSD